MIISTRSIRYSASSAYVIGRSSSERTQWELRSPFVGRADSATRWKRIVCWGAPVYPDMSAIDDALANTGLMTRLFAANTAWARAACQWNCSHRTLAGWVAAVLAPSIPVPIARAASLHSWAAYRDAMDCLIGGTDWSNLTGRATASGAFAEARLGRLGQNRR